MRSPHRHHRANSSSLLSFYAQYNEENRRRSRGREPSFLSLLFMLHQTPTNRSQSVRHSRVFQARTSRFHFVRLQSLPSFQSQDNQRELLEFSIFRVPSHLSNSLSTAGVCSLSLLSIQFMDLDSGSFLICLISVFKPFYTITLNNNR